MGLTALPSSKASILVMDPDQATETRLRRLLAEEGFHLADVDSSVDLVIAGVAAGRDLDAVTEVILRLGRSVPVVALIDQRAWTGFDFFDAANTLGAAAVLQKPFPRSALLRLIGVVLSQAQGPAGDGEFDRQSGTPESFFSRAYLHLA